MRIILALGLILLAGCESDAEKLAELRFLESYHSLALDHYEGMYEDAQERWDSTGYSVDSMSAWTDSIMEPYRMHRDSLDLVRRDIARLLR